MACRFVICFLLPRLLAGWVVSSFFHVINNPVINFLVHKSWSVPLIISVGSIPRSRILGSRSTGIYRALGIFWWRSCRKLVPSLMCVPEPVQGTCGPARLLSLEAIVPDLVDGGVTQPGLHFHFLDGRTRLPPFFVEAMETDSS